MRPLKRDLRAARAASVGVGLRRKALLGTALRSDLRAVKTWRGHSPRIALRNHYNHPAWWTYRTHPPVPYAPSPLAQLDHWINRLPERNGWSQTAAPSRRALRRRDRPHVLEVEHWCFLTGARPDQWELALTRRGHAEDRLRAPQCKAVVTQSRGLLEHFRRFLAPDVCHKLHHIFPAVPSQPEAATVNGDTFTILAIANRLSDKGIPEALRAFAILRGRLGPRVRMVLVSGTARRWRRQFPPELEVVDTIRMNPELKAQVYRRADVLLEPTYSEGLANIPEACAFGVPTVATRIHHGEDFVQDGVSGFLVDSPLSAYSEGYGTRWRSWAKFMGEIDRMRAQGGLDRVMEGIVDRLEPMATGEIDLDHLRSGARRLHTERFSPGVRNARINEIYRLALTR